MSLLKRTAECAEACGTCSFQFLVILSDISDISSPHPHRTFAGPRRASPPDGVCAFDNTESLHFLFEIAKRSIAITSRCWYNANRKAVLSTAFPNAVFFGE